MPNPLFALLSLSATLLLTSTPPLLAQPTSSPATQGGSSDPAPPTQGTGSRGYGGSCAKLPDDANPAEEPSLTALIPATKVILTEQERVNVYAYIPPESDRLAAFEMIDLQTGEVMVAEEFELTAADTVARFVLPDTVQLPATKGFENRYEWSLFIYCDVAVNPDDVIYVEGWIHRLEPGHAAESPILWHEAIESWFAEREANPTAWQDGLTRYGFGKYRDRDIQTYTLPASRF